MMIVRQSRLFLHCQTTQACQVSCWNGICVGDEERRQAFFLEEDGRTKQRCQELHPEKSDFFFFLFYIVVGSMF